MSWSFVANSGGSGGVWKATRYDDLHYAEINNLAQYGQPYSPYESGYHHNHVPDFGNIVVQMPHTQVMTNGYGRNIRPGDFPIVTSFLSTGDVDGERGRIQ